MDGLTPTEIIGGAFALVCALGTAIYKEPKAYDDLLKPVFKWMSLMTFFIGIGVFLGHLMVSNALLSFIQPARLEEARKAFTSSQNSGYIFWAVAMLTFVLDICLYVLAEKVQKWRSEE